MPNCRQCTIEFEITDEDRKFYNRMKVPEPIICPACRQQIMMSYRNERTFYSRKCDKCEKNIISIYSPGAKNPVYCTECWWGDGWDPFDYGNEFDFSRPFFEQFQELINSVPQLNSITALGENDEYSNYCYRCKDCYLLISSDDCWGCHFANYLWNCKDCLDSLYVTESQLCYELIDSHNCYHCFYSQELESSNDCWLSFDLKGCKNCFCCAGLRQKTYHWFNEPLEKEEYKKRISELKLSHSAVNLLKEKLVTLKNKIPRKFSNLINCENCTGDHLKDSKNSYDCYDSYGLEDCKNIINGPGKIKDCYDFCGAKEIELSIGGVSAGGPGINLRYNWHAWDGCSNVDYSAFSVSSQNLFGCICLRHKQYCILNKQYSKEEYEDLVPKIIEHMKSSGEWGNYFPMSISPFSYNETVAQEYFPLTKDDVIKQGRRWRNSNEKDYQPQTCKVPENIDEVENNITSKILACSSCEKNFKIIDQELKFYKQNGIPIPSKCPNCRHMDRMNQRNPHKLYNRKCDKCQSDIQTTYSPDRPEKIYCEQCYLKEVY